MARAATATTTAAKDVAKDRAAKGLEDVFDVGELRPGILATLAEGLVTKLVIALLLRFIRQHAVGLGCLFELLFGSLVTRILVRVVLHGQLAVGALDRVRIRGALDTEHFVVVALVSHDFE